METYGHILVIVTPLFLFLVLFEKWYGWYKGKETVETLDMISSLSSGVTNSTKDVLGLSVGILSYPWLLEHFTIIQVQSGILLYFIAFMALDFAGYWGHRINHTYNIFWNNHLVHHSSEQFNLACALRQSISVFIRIYTFLLLPAALLGVPPKVIAVIGPLHLFAQLWYHTCHIKKMGWLEKIIVTPAHHRVHHAINPEYLDKNFGQIFIFWDKIFGTFQEERDDIPAVYGITIPVRTWNPIKINFLHLWLLIKDAWHTQSWKDKFRIWLMPLGWRPSDVVNAYPIYKIEDVYNFNKYETNVSKSLKIYLWFQLFSLLLIVSYLYGHIASIGSPDIFIYGAFIFLHIYSLTDLMDGNRKIWMLETIKNGTCIGWIIQSGDWFGSDQVSPAIATSLQIYFTVTVFLVYYFCQSKKQSIVV